MIRKSERQFRRRARTWNRSSAVSDRHIERVLRQTWWLFGIIPLYSRDRIISDNLP